MGVSGYPYLSSVGNGSGMDGEKWSRCTNNRCVCAEKIHRTIVYVLRLYPTAIDVILRIFWVLVGRMKVVMNSLSNLFWPHSSDYFCTLPVFFPIFLTKLWENLFNSIVTSLKNWNIWTRLQFQYLKTWSSDLTRKLIVYMWIIWKYLFLVFNAIILGYL